MIKQTLLCLTAMYGVVPVGAHAISPKEQKALTMRMCERVIDEYADYPALKLPYKDFQVLEAEFQRCKELIDGYLLDGT